MSKSILLVDDEASIREAFSAILAIEGHDVTVSPSYEEALQELDSREFDLIIADIVLGSRTGMDLLDEVKARKLQAPVVMITGQPSFDSAAQAVRLGAFDYLFKPVRREELLKTARKGLEVKELLDEKKRVEDENTAYREHLEELVSERTRQLQETNRNLNEQIERRKQVETSLRISENRYRELVETAPYGVFEADANGTITFCNTYLASLHDMSPEEIIGKPLWGLDRNPDTAAMHKENFHRAVSGNPPDNPTYVGLTPRDGMQLEVQADWRLRTDEYGEILGLVVVLTDITTLRRTAAELERRVDSRNQALKRSRDTIRALLDVSDDPVMLIDLDGDIGAANAACAKRLGEPELVGRNVYHLLSKKSASRYRSSVQQAVERAEQVRFTDQDDQTVYEISAYPILDARGDPYRVALFGHDITAMTLAERQIKALTRQLLKAQEGERQRIALDLHDHVAQDLSSLKIACETFFDDQTDVQPVVQKRLGELSQALLRTIADVRHMAYDLRPPGLDKLGLARTLNQYCTDFSQNTGLPVDFFSAGMDDLDLEYEVEINLYRIVQEALSNVRKHASATAVTVRLAASHPNIILRVEDNGCGFDVQAQSRLSHSQRMGLQGMKQRAALLNGALTLRSEEGQGTRLLAEIPFARHKQ